LGERLCGVELLMCFGPVELLGRRRAGVAGWAWADPVECEGG